MDGMSMMFVHVVHRSGKLHAGCSRAQPFRSLAEQVRHDICLIYVPAARLRRLLPSFFPMEGTSQASFPRMTALIQRRRF